MMNLPEEYMDGFTLVLLAAWLILLGTFGTMYAMDRATQKAARKRARVAEQTPVRRQ
ncbi:MAG: hypothetical protein HY313_07310 [Acidobacteria bacterium]|nr:hypothetical protein [Acidobacteriota bacterium]